MRRFARRILLVEDEPLLSSLMSQVLEDTGFLVRTCATEVEGRRAVAEFDPDAALIDVHLRTGPAGLYLAHAIARAHPEVGILLLSRFEDLSAAGLDGWDLPPGSAFLRKDQLADRTALVAAVDAVLRGAGQAAEDLRAAGALSGLTRTQAAVLRLAALGLTNAAIARRRGTTERSIERSLAAAYEALGIPLEGDLNPRVEAVRRFVAAAGLPVDADAADR